MKIKQIRYPKFARANATVSSKMLAAFRSLARARFIAAHSLCHPQKQHVLNVKVKVAQHNLIPIKFFSTQSSHETEIKCWQCGISKKNIGELFCEKCHSIQNPHDTKNYFKVFELQESYKVDPKKLQQKYREMQSLLHPDKFSNKSSKEKVISEEFSALVNRAYDILQTPLKRAVHLLALKGESIKDDEKIDDPDFLMQIMEFNEEVENADTPEKLIQLDEKNKEVLYKLEVDIEKNFDSNLINEAKVNIVKMKYFNSIRSYIHNLMRERGITL